MDNYAKDDQWFGDLCKEAQPPGADAVFKDRLRQRVLEAAGGPRSAAKQQPVSRRRARVFAVASAAAAAVAAGVIIWALAGNVEHASAAFSDVLARIKGTTSVSFDLTAYSGGKIVLHAKQMMKKPGRLRIVQDDGKTEVLDPNGSYLIFSPKKRLARLVKGPGGPFMDPLERLQSIGQRNGRFIGRKTLKGVEVNAYLVTGDGWEMTVYTDPVTNLPVRIESTGSPGSSKSDMVVVDQFRWNVPLDDSLFSLKPPAGYSMDRSLENASEGDLVETLRSLAHLSAGVFPDKFDNASVLSAVERDQIKRTGKPMFQGEYGTVNSDEKSTAVVRAAWRGLAFVDHLGREGGWRYVGAGVKLGDSRSPVCWWTDPKTHARRTICGDLTIKETVEPGAVSGRPGK